MRIGVLALQGDVREHLRSLVASDVEAVAVRRPGELAAVDGLVIPGGESTTIAKLAVVFGLLEPLRERIAAGLPVYGSCAGMILLADRIIDAPTGQPTIGGIDMTVRRNAFGRQVDSFEQPVEVEGIPGEPFTAVFIRAPWVEQLGPSARALATVTGSVEATGNEPAAGRVVAVRQGPLLASSFHPELTGDTRMHAYFCAVARELI